MTSLVPPPPKPIQFFLHYYHHFRLSSAGILPNPLLNTPMTWVERMYDYFYKEWIEAIFDGVGARESIQTLRKLIGTGLISKPASEKVRKGIHQMGQMRKIHQAGIHWTIDVSITLLLMILKLPRSLRWDNRMILIMIVEQDGGGFEGMSPKWDIIIWSDTVICC